MSIKTPGVVAVLAVVVLCFGLPASAQYEVSVQFTGGFTATWDRSGTDYEAGVYSALIDGKTSPGMICDDFNDEIVSGEKWNANAYQASSLTSANINETLFGKSIGITGYAEVATLVSMLFNNGTTYGSITGITQADLSSAIWDITTSGGLSGLDAKAKSLVAAVEKAFNGNSTKAQTYLATLTNLWILTPTILGSGEAQEVWTEGLKVPEGGTSLMYLLLAGASCFGAMLFNLKNRIGRGVTA